MLRPWQPGGESVPLGRRVERNAKQENITFSHGKLFGFNQREPCRLQRFLVGKVLGRHVLGRGAQENDTQIGFVGMRGVLFLYWFVTYC